MLFLGFYFSKNKQNVILHPKSYPNNWDMLYNLKNKQLMKIRNILLSLMVVASIFSCKKDEKPHDARKQAIEDNRAIVNYLDTHYLDENGILRTIKAGERPIRNDINSKTITENNIDYKLYYLTVKEGVGTYAKDIDSVYISYSGILLDSTVFQSKVSKHWVHLANPRSRYNITGFRKGATFFKSGVLKVNPDESFYFENSGQGYVFIPSGLAYRNRGTSMIPKNSSLIFKFNIKDVKAVKIEEK